MNSPRHASIRSPLQFVTFMVGECTDMLTLQEVGEWADRFENQELCNVVEHVFQRALSIFADRYA